MKLYKIYQNVNNDYDTYSEAVVCAESEEEAKKIHPDGELSYVEKRTTGEYEKADEEYGSWAKKKYVKVKFLGTAEDKIKKGVIVASYHAG